MKTGERQSMRYYCEDAESVLKSLDSSETGISEAEAAQRLARCGKNKLEAPKGKPIILRFFEQLADPMIIILLAAAAISAVLAVTQGDSFADVIIILTSEAAKADEIQKQYEKPVVAVYADGFLDKQFIDSLKLIGDVAGTEEQADKVCNAIQGWIDDLSARTKDIPDEKKPAVYNGGMGFRGPHGFEGTSANYPPFMAVNIKNVADETGEKGAFLVDLEKVTVT